MDKYKEEICEVEEIVYTRRGKGVVQYRVRWTGCTVLKDKWKMFDHMDNCAKKLQEFRQKIPKKP